MPVQLQKYILPVAAVSFLAFISASAAVLRSLWRLRKQSQALMKVMPSAPRHWIYGSQVESLDGTPMTTLMLRRSARYPRGFITWIGYFSPVAHFNHPDLIKLVLKRSDPKSWGYHKALKPWLGEGLLISSGNKWFKSRRLLTPAFHFDVLKQYVKVYNDAAEIFMGKIETMEVEKGGHKFALFNNVCSMSLDIILQCAFSYESNCQLEDQGNPYVKAVFDLAKLFNIRMRTVSVQWFPWLYWITTNGKKFLALCHFVHKEATNIINRRVNELEESEGQILEDKKYLDFLDILLTTRDEDGNGMAPADIRAEVDTFLFEGHDTTASGTSWALYCLAQHPEHQAKIHKELDELMADRHSDEIEWHGFSLYDCVDRDDIGKIPYTLMCLKEALRLYPPVPLIGRQLSEDLPFNGQIIPKGTNVTINILGCHHNPSVWGDDHMEYKPDRFLPENFKDRSPYAFVGFSAGPRYRFEVADNCPSLQTEVRLVLRPKDEIYLRAIPRF